MLMSRLRLTVPGAAAAQAIARSKLHELMATGVVRADCTEWQALLLARQRHAQEPAGHPVTRRRAT